MILRDIEEPIQDNVHIRKCIAYIQSILNSTLDISKLDDGRLDFQLKDVYLRSEILELAMTMLVSMRAETVVTEIICEEGIFVVADPLRLTQVVVNLLTNAFKFCKVTCRTCRMLLVSSIHVPFLLIGGNGQSGSLVSGDYGYGAHRSRGHRPRSAQATPRASL